MKVLEYIERNKREIKEYRKHETREHNLEYNLLSSNLDLIEKLPYDLSFQGSWDGRLHFSAYCSSDENVKSLIAEVRQILDIKRSEKELNVHSGKLTYITENEVFKITVAGGSIPDNCILTEEEVSHISKTYRMECK